MSSGTFGIRRGVIRVNIWCRKRHSERKHLRLDLSLIAILGHLVSMELPQVMLLKDGFRYLKTDLNERLRKHRETEPQVIVVFGTVIRTNLISC